MQFQH